MRAIFLGLCLLLFSLPAMSSGVQVSMGVFKNMTQYQDKDAKDDRDPYLPMVDIGYNFERVWGLIFSPQFFYAFGSKQSNDSYGGDYKVKTYGLLYDFLYPFNEGLAFRFGFGNVIKSFKGEGGEVTVPNGSGTSTAYKPEKSEKSHTGTLNLGVETTFPSDLMPMMFTYLGARAEFLISSPLKSSKRSSFLMISFQGYF
ncbi:MAG: hypothetical protein ACJAT2_001494 [Bacteriovoracaceae bacterium]|jgi:hypothetical protein